jgi:hypothetical protein
MKTSRNRPYRSAITAAAVLLLGAGTVHPVVAKAADAPIPCSAFVRNAHGGWRVLSPVTLDFGGLLYSPMVGTTFVAGSTEHGIEMSDVLDQQCGNR